MAGAVSDEGDLRLIGATVLAGTEAVEEGADEADEVDVSQFVVASDVVGGTDVAMLDDGEEGAGVVFDKEPVANVFSCPVDGNGFAGDGVENDDGDQFFGKLPRAVVVLAVRHNGGEAIGVVPGADEVVG